VLDMYEKHKEVQLLRAIYAEEQKLDDEKNLDQLTPEYFGIEEEEYKQILKSLEKDKLIKGATYTQKTRVYSLGAVRVTEKGKQYIKDRAVKNIIVNNSITQLKWLFRAFLILALALLLTETKIIDIVLSWIK
jgi:DNA-binding PadR family transcriptional regulator